MKDLVSVIIPTHGGAEFLSRCIESVINQTYNNIEIIIVDDNGIGSENQIKTEQAIAQYINNNNIIYICHKVNLNGAAARNTGVKASKGKYIALLDDDDIFFPDNIENHIKAWSTLDKSYGLTYCDNEVCYPNGVKTSIKKTFSGQDLYSILMHDIVIGSSTMVVRRDVWDCLGGFDESFRRHQDFEFTARLMAKYKVFATQKLGERYIIMNRNTPKSIEKAIELRLYYLNKMKPLIQTLSHTKRKKVVASNIVQVAFQYIKERKFKQFYRTMRKNNIGSIWVIWALGKRLNLTIKNKIKTFL